MKKIPTKEDIYYYGMLEEEYAVQNFYGKTEDEAAELFFLNSEYYGGDFLWMGVNAYFYYINSIKKYLQSEEGKSDVVFMDLIVYSIKSRLENDENFRYAFENHEDNILNILNVLTLIKEIIDEKKLRENDDFYEEFLSCYEDLPNAVTDLIELCKTAQERLLKKK